MRNRYFFIILSVFLLALSVFPQDINELKKKYYEALENGDEERAWEIKKKIKDIKAGRESAPLSGDKAPEVVSVEKQAALDLLNSDEIKKLDSEINGRRKGESLRDDYIKAHEDEYLARSFLLDGKKMIVKGEYLHAREFLAEAYKIKPHDKDISYYYKLTSFPSLNAAVEKNMYSLLNDPVINITVEYSPSDEGHSDWCRSWEMQLVNVTRNAEVVRTWSGEKDPLSDLSWDGKDGKGKTVPDGDYILKIEIKGDYFCKMRSKPVKFQIQSELPAVQLSIANVDKRFVAGDDEVVIKSFCQERKNIAKWTLTVINQSGELVRRLTGEKLPEEISWDGKNEAGSHVNEGDILTVKLRGADKLGKDWESNEDTIESDIRIEDNKISLNNINFESGKAVLKSESLQILDKVVKVFQDYAWFDVSIIGHTDDVGDDAYNKKLSESRARAVTEYLTRQGIDKKRLKFEGRGEAEPIADNNTEEGKARNRRVEFLLVENQERKMINIEQRRREARERALGGKEQ